MATRYRITLTETERQSLTMLTRSSKTNAPKFVHARALLLCDVGEFAGQPPWKVTEVAEALGISARTIEHVKERFVEEGMDAALGRKPRSGQRDLTFDGAFDARLTALACSKPPVGRARWTVRLLADKLVELQIVPKVSVMSVQRSLKKTSYVLT
jgi:transposase